MFSSLIIRNDSILSFPYQSHKSKFDQEHKQEQQQQQQIVVIIILFFDHAERFDSSESMRPCMVDANCNLSASHGIGWDSKNGGFKYRLVESVSVAAKS